MTCENTGNPGRNYCKSGSIFGKPSGVILAKKTYTQTAADFLLEATWVTAIENEDVFPIMKLKDFVENSSEATYHEYPSEDRKLTSQGKYRFEMHFDMAECQKKELLNFRQYDGLIYFVYGKVVRGRSIDAGVNVVGVRTELVNIEKATMPLMDGSPEMVKLIVDLEDEIDLNEYDFSREMAWNVSALDSLTPVDVAQSGVASATSLVISVTADCYGQSNPITGLAFADFSIVGTGTLGVEGDFVDNGDGTYTFVTVGLITSDAVDIVAPPSQSGDLLIKSSGPAIITVT